MSTVVVSLTRRPGQARVLAIATHERCVFDVPRKTARDLARALRRAARGETVSFSWGPHRRVIECERFLHGIEVRKFVDGVIKARIAIPIEALDDVLASIEDVAPRAGSRSPDGSPPVAVTGGGVGWSASSWPRWRGPTPDDSNRGRRGEG